MIFDTFSKRLKRATKGDQPDVYNYDQIPAPLRVQIVHICRDAIGVVDSLSYDNTVNGRWKIVYDIVLRELGVFNIGDDYSNVDIRCQKFFCEKANTLEAIDFIEIAFRVIERVVDMRAGSDRQYLRNNYVDIDKKQAIDELNHRFKEHGIGYSFEDSEIIRIDNKFLHSEVTKPALLILSNKEYVKASEDFKTAHEHYRNSNYKDCIVAAQRAFESTMKAICTKKCWIFGQGDRASDLIKVLRKNNLFPDYLGAGFDCYVAMLKTGLPEIRNNAGGHGESPSATPTPGYIAAYALHMTATNIVMLADALNELGT